MTDKKDELISSFRAKVDKVQVPCSGCGDKKPPDDTLFGVIYGKEGSGRRLRVVLCKKCRLATLIVFLRDHLRARAGKQTVGGVDEPLKTLDLVDKEEDLGAAGL